jgi:adenylylsulfate kinase
MTADDDAPGLVVWFTGLPAAGKTTLARAVRRRLTGTGKTALLLDSDALRAVLTPEPAYTASERDWFYGALGRLAGLLARQGVTVLVAATANRRVYRDEARANAPHFAEVHVQCDLETCRARDPKGIYARAGSDDANTVPGLGAVYEEPLAPEARVDTTDLSPAAAAAAVLEQLQAFFTH